MDNTAVPLRSLPVLDFVNGSVVNATEETKYDGATYEFETTADQEKTVQATLILDNVSNAAIKKSYVALYCGLESTDGIKVWDNGKPHHKVWCNDAKNIQDSCAMKFLLPTKPGRYELKLWEDRINPFSPGYSYPLCKNKSDHHISIKFVVGLKAVLLRSLPVLDFVYGIIVNATEETKYDGTTYEFETTADQEKTVEVTLKLDAVSKAAIDNSKPGYVAMYCGLESTDGIKVWDNGKPRHNIWCNDEKNIMDCCSLKFVLPKKPGRYELKLWEDRSKVLSPGYSFPLCNNESGHQISCRFVVENRIAEEQRLASEKVATDQAAADKTNEEDEEKHAKDTPNAADADQTSVKNEAESDDDTIEDYEFDLDRETEIKKLEAEINVMSKRRKKSGGHGGYRRCIKNMSKRLDKLKCCAAIDDMKKHGENNVDVAKKGCGALADLAGNNDANRTMIGQEGGIQVIIQMMEKHGESNVDVAKYGCVALTSLANNNAENSTIIETEGGIPVIRQNDY